MHKEWTCQKLSICYLDGYGLMDSGIFSTFNLGVGGGITPRNYPYVTLMGMDLWTEAYSVLLITGWGETTPQKLFIYYIDGYGHMS